MAWLAVDNKTYTECVFECKPERASNFWYDAAGGNHADREVSTRNNMFYDTKTNELLAEVKLKDENGNKY